MVKKNNKALYLISIVSTVVAYLINVNNLAVISVLLTVIGILISMFDIKKGCLFFFIMALVFSDFTFEGTYDTDNSAAFGGIYMANLGGGTLMVYWAIINFALIFIHKGRWAVQALKTKKIFIILIISFLFSFIGFAYNVTTSANLVFQTAVSDFRIYINVFLGFLTLILIVDKRDDLVKYFNVFILILLTQIVIVITSSYLISRTKTIYTFFSGTETYLMGIALVYFLFLFKQKKNNLVDSSPKMLLLAGIFTIILFLFIVPSRGRMIALSIALLLYLIYSNKWQYAVLAPLFVLVAVYVVQLINPNFYNYFLFKIATFSPDSEGADSSKVRYIEAVNILGELFTNPYYLFFGKGFGGYFVADFMSYSGVALGTGSYSPAWIAEGKFYKPHGSWLYFLLKNGFVMTVLFYYYIVRVVIRGWTFFKRAPASIFKTIGLSVLFLLPYVSIIMFSSKLQIMFGILIGFIYLSVHYASVEMDSKIKSLQAV